MVQRSKNLLLNHKDTSVYDELLSNIFDTPCFERLVEIDDPKVYFNSIILPILIKLRTKLLPQQHNNNSSSSNDNNDRVINNLLNKPIPSTIEERRNYLYHIITGGGGSIFKYKDKIYKMSSTNTNIEITSSNSIAEVFIPHYLQKLFAANEYQYMTQFFLTPLYVRYGNFYREFKALYNLRIIYHYIIAFSVAFRNVKQLPTIKEIINSVQSSYEGIPINNKTLLLDDDKMTLIYLYYITNYLGINILITNRLHTFKLISTAYTNKFINGYITIAPEAVISGDKLTTEFLASYFNDDCIDYYKLIQKLSSQLMFQILIFYYVLLKMKPSFVHRDLKLDNILVKKSMNRKIEFDIVIEDKGVDVEYHCCIDSPFTFMINDFDRAVIESDNRTWFQDIHYFLHSVKHYANLNIDQRIFDVFYIHKKNEIEDLLCTRWIYHSNLIEFNHYDLGCLIKEGVFSEFIKLKLQ